MIRGKSSSRWARSHTGSSCSTSAAASAHRPRASAPSTVNRSRGISVGFVVDAVAVACTAILVWFGTGLHPWWPLLWLAPLPALLIATRSGRARTFLVAFVGFFLGNLNLWYYLHDVLSAPVLVLLLEFALQALLFA